MPKSAKSGGGTQSLNDGLEDINPAHREENEAYIYNSVAVLLGEFYIVYSKAYFKMLYFSISICWNDYLYYFVHKGPSS